MSKFNIGILDGYKQREDCLDTQGIKTWHCRVRG